ncbi:hypothetical protein [Serratia sp. Se-RSBMAAmG]|uniref:hypothetical protein n=1 Tax=Serratia sp. Se-RSBMAAmG TaxID=3043305 RepID=UPI0024AF9E57|nr:hypothetical protein [Serratia sp. Se-RSBMAAmG]MDI6976604.1 hypothetical protein [Serratia sp. Se-RSBMAAmG]
MLNKIMRLFRKELIFMDSETKKNMDNTQKHLESLNENKSLDYPHQKPVDYDKAPDYNEHQKKIEELSKQLSERSNKK